MVGVEPRGWLVEDEDLGVVNQGGSKAHALAESLRKLGNALVPLGAQAHVGNECFGAVAAHAVEIGHIMQVLGDVEVGVERVVLGQVAQNLPNLEALLGAVHSVNHGGTGVGRKESAQNFHEGGLARAVGPEQPVDLAGLGI